MAKEGKGIEKVVVGENVGKNIDQQREEVVKAIGSSDFKRPVGISLAATTKNGRIYIQINILSFSNLDNKKEKAIEYLGYINEHFLEGKYVIGELSKPRESEKQLRGVGYRAYIVELS